MTFWRTRRNVSIKLSVAIKQITSKLSGFKQHKFIISEFLWVRNLQAVRLSGSDPTFLMRLQSRCWLGLQTSKGSTQAGGSASKVHINIAIGGKPQSSLYGAPHKSVECPHHMAVGFPPERKSVKESIDISLKYQCPMQDGASTSRFLPPTLIHSCPNELLTPFPLGYMIHESKLQKQTWLVSKVTI